MTTITVNTQNLQNIAKQLKVIQPFYYIQLSYKDKKLEVRCNESTLLFQQHIEATLIDGLPVFTVVIDAQAFYKFVCSLKTNENKYINTILKIYNKKIKIISDDLATEINDCVYKPILIDKTNTFAFSISGLELLESLKKCRTFIHPDIERPNVNGVFLDLNNQQIFSTDGKRLYTRPASFETTNNIGRILIPAKIMQLLINSINTKDEIFFYCNNDSTLNIQIRSNNISIDFENQNQSFPDTSYIMPYNESVEVTLNTGTLLKTLKEIYKLSKNKLFNTCNIVITENTCTFFHDHSKTEINKIPIDCDATINTRYNTKYLLDYIKLHKEKTLTLLFDSYKRVFINSNDQQYVCMPLID